MNNTGIAAVTRTRDDTTSGSEATVGRAPSLAWIILASSFGSLIEWYDFFLYQTLAVFFSTRFFPSSQNGRLGVLLSMATLGIGFLARPAGAAIFGALGDRFGRKYTFVLTMLIMGAATTCIGLLPTFTSAGYVATASLLLLRIAQGMAAGGEIGGASTYVVEFVPSSRRGFYMGILYVMSPIGTLLALAAVFLCRSATGEAHFDDWGWRIPFLLSGVLVLVSIYLRLRLQETPIFQELRRGHKLSKSPLRELFMNLDNVKRLLVAVFGFTAGQGAVGITAMVFFLKFHGSHSESRHLDGFCSVLHRHRLRAASLRTVWLVVGSRRPPSHDSPKHRRCFNFFPAHLFRNADCLEPCALPYGRLLR